MNAKKKTLSDAAVFRACFDRIAEKGLGKTRLSDIARTLKIPMPQLYTTYPSVEAILGRFCDHVDANMLEAVTNDDSSSKRDLYFEMIMARIDALQEYRPGVVRWLKDLGRVPERWPGTLCRFEQSMALMLDRAGDSPVFPVKKIGISYIYAATLRAWIKDETADMAQTMAALDKELARGATIIDRYMRPKKAA